MWRALAAAFVVAMATSPAGGAPPAALDARTAGAVADGTHDDGPALQAALDRLAASGGVLHLPAGTYALRAPLVLRGDRVAVRGDGAVLAAAPGFAAGAAGALLVTTTRDGGKAAALRGLEVEGVAFDGGGIAPTALRLERVRDLAVRRCRVRGLAAGGAGAIVVRSAGDAENDSGEIVVEDNVVELDVPTAGIVLRKVVNCRVRGNRVQGNGGAGGHGLDLTLSQGCTVSDNMLFAPDVGVLADGANHLQISGNYVWAPHTGFRAGPVGKQAAANVVFVNNRVLTGGAGFEVAGSGMMLVGNYAAFLSPGPAIWVKPGGSHDAVVANNASVAREGGIRFDASDGVVAANVPTANGAAGIEVNGRAVAVTGNALNGNPVGIRLGSAAAACTVVGNTVEKASEASLVIAGTGHRVRDNVAGTPAPEAGPGALYGSGEAGIEAARTPVAAAFPDDRYVVTIEWAGDPGGREWIAEKSAAGFTIVLPGAPRAPVRARWTARGL